MSNALSEEMLKMWFEDKPYVSAPKWISYIDKENKRIGPRDKLNQSKVEIKPERLQKTFGPWKADISLSPSETDRSGISAILIFDAPEDGNILMWWEFPKGMILDLKAGESATVWNPIG